MGASLGEAEPPRPWRIERLSFRVENARRASRLSVSGLRLAGRAGEHALDPAAEAARWRGQQEARPDRGPDGKRPALVFLCDPKPENSGRRLTFLRSEKLDTPADLGDFAEPRLAWRLDDNSQGFARPLILRLDWRDGAGVARSTDWQVPALQLWPELTRATTEERAGDTAAEMVWADWFAPGAWWRRRAVLTREVVMGGGTSFGARRSRREAS